MRRLSVLIVCALLGVSCRRSPSVPQAVSWDKKTRMFAWWGGEVEVPRGFIYVGGVGGDTSEGHFDSPDGQLVIQYDIGSYAGAYANRENAISFEEQSVESARVWTARRALENGRGGTDILVAVTFPDGGCANFFLYSSRPEAAELIARIAQTYRPRVREGSGSSSCGGVSPDDKRK